MDAFLGAEHGASHMPLQKQRYDMRVCYAKRVFENSNDVILGMGRCSMKIPKQIASCIGYKEAKDTKTSEKALE